MHEKQILNGQEIDAQWTDKQTMNGQRMHNNEQYLNCLQSFENKSSMCVCQPLNLKGLSTIVTEQYCC